MIAYVLLRVLFIMLLVAANAFFAAAEFALVSVRETRILQLIEAHRIGARTVLKLHQHLDQVVNGVQLGVTVASLALGWVGEPLLATLIQGTIGKIPYAAVYSHAIAIVVAFILITGLHVILGELVPKSLALQRAERVALAVAGPMDVFLTITRPLVFAMTGAAKGVLRALGLREIRHGAVHSPDELRLIVTASHQFGQLAAVPEEMILNSLDLENVSVREVMVPRTKIFSLPADLSLDEALARVVEEQHSRIPVYDPQRGPEHIIGVLYAKDLMRWTRLRLASSPTSATAQRIAIMQISQIMHDVLVVPETKPLTDLLTEFRERKRHLAVVVDEFGSTAGVVTVEDVLEQIVGELEDEFDVPPPKQPPLGTDAPLTFEGSYNLLDLESQHNLVLPRNGSFETLAGFVMARLQRIPRIGDFFDYEGHRFTVEAMGGHRIARVRIEHAPAEEEKASSRPFSNTA